jgi:hypothetical protein
MKNKINDIERAILNLHKCSVVWIESAQIKETFGDQTVWEGVVEVFDLVDHPSAKKCYAWSYEQEGTKKRKYVAVLHQYPIKSPVDAVRAFIVSERQKS